MCTEVPKHISERILEKEGERRAHFHLSVLLEDLLSAETLVRVLSRNNSLSFVVSSTLPFPVMSHVTRLSTIAGQCTRIQLGFIFIRESVWFLISVLITMISSYLFLFML